MCKLDQDTLEIIIRTDANVEHIMKELDKGHKRFEKIDSRLRKIEQLFIPAVGFIGLISHKFFGWIKL